MSQHGSLLRTVTTKAIQNDWKVWDAADFLNEILDDLEWDHEVTEQNVIDTAKYMITQESGIYGGLSTTDIEMWLKNNRVANSKEIPETVMDQDDGNHFFD